MFLQGATGQFVGVGNAAAAVVAYTVVKANGTEQNGIGVITQLGGGTINFAYKIGLDATELDILGAIGIILVGAGNACVGVVNDTVVTALPGGDVANVTGSVGSVTGPLSGAANNAIADAYLDRANAIEAGLTPRQAQRLVAAVVGGKAALGSGTVAYSGPGTSTTRATATCPGDGSRTSWSYNL